MHPYAAPIESTRLAGLPATFIATAQNDVLHVEAEQYAGRLIDSGVATHVTRWPDMSHAALADDPAALLEGVHFFQCRFGRLSTA
jgi:acetyl esterase/lipase